MHQVAEAVIVRVSLVKGRKSLAGEIDIRGVGCRPAPPYTNPLPFALITPYPTHYSHIPRALRWTTRLIRTFR